MASNEESNKALVRRFFAAIEAADLQAFDQIVAADYDDHLPGQSPGRDVLKKYFASLHGAFGDLKLPVHHLVAEGDKVAVLNSVTGIHKAEFIGLKAAGKPINAMAFQLYRIHDGKLAEHWEVADYMTLMRQMQG